MTPSDPTAAPGEGAMPPVRWRRLHPATLLLKTLAYGRALIVPALIVFFLARNSVWEYWLLLGFLPAVAFEVLRYITLRYRLGAGELVIRRGVLFRTERHIPFSRIQNVNLSQGPLHRVLRVADVTLETAGEGGEPDAALSVLSLEAVEEIRARLATHRISRPAGPAAADAVPIPAAEPPPRELLVRLGPGELVLLGTMTVRGLALVAVAIGLFWQFDLGDRLNLREALDWLLRQRATDATAVLGGGILVGGAILLMILSIAWALLRFWDYRVEASADSLHLTGGLLTRRSAAIPRRRIQTLTVRQAPLYRLFGRAALRVETAGGAGTRNDGDNTRGGDLRVVSQQWFVPSIPPAHVAPLVARILPAVDLSAIRWQPLAPGAGGRMMRKNALVAFVLSAPPVYLVPWPGVLAVPLFLTIAVWHAWRSAAIMGWAVTPAGIAFRSGVIVRKVSLALAEKVQVAAVSETPFDRRKGMARLRVDTAGAGPAEHALEIPYLPRATAEAVAHHLLRQVARRRPAEAPPVRSP